VASHRTREGSADEHRLSVTSPDGTRLAVWIEGSGPPIVLVHGSMSDHATLAALTRELRSTFTTYAMDRRGFGESGDATHYSLEREVEDVAAVADAAAERSGPPVAVFGHSFGANPALGAATRSAHVSHLVLYEPSLGLRYPAGSIEEYERLIDAGDVEGAMRSILIDIAGMDERDVDGLRASPSWPARLASAPTVVRECRVEDGWSYRAGMFDGVTAAALLLTGSDSPKELVDTTYAAAVALPHSRIEVLDGHGHFAYRTHPALVAAIVREFLEA